MLSCRIPRFVNEKEVGTTLLLPHCMSTSSGKLILRMVKCAFCRPFGHTAPFSDRMSSSIGIVNRVPNASFSILSSPLPLHSPATWPSPFFCLSLSSAWGSSRSGKCRSAYPQPTALLHRIFQWLARLMIVQLVHVWASSDHPRSLE